MRKPWLHFMKHEILTTSKTSFVPINKAMISASLVISTVVAQTKANASGNLNIID